MRTDGGSEDWWVRELGPLLFRVLVVVVVVVLLLLLVCTYSKELLFITPTMCIRSWCVDENDDRPLSHHAPVAAAEKHLDRCTNLLASLMDSNGLGVELVVGNHTR